MNQGRLGEHYNRYQRQNVVEQNTNQFEQMNYSNAHGERANQSLSLVQESEIVYDDIVYYLSISSRDRDVDAYPNVYEYAVTFPREFKNISSIELIQAIVPNKADVILEPYLLLKIDELEDVMVSLDRNISDAFAILQLCKPILPDEGFLHIDKRIHEKTIKYFKTPKASLSKMTVHLTKYDGAGFTFGTSPGSSESTDSEYQNTFVFKLVCKEKRRATLNHRNVF